MGHRLEKRTREFLFLLTQEKDLEAGRQVPNILSWLVGLGVQGHDLLTQWPCFELGMPPKIILFGYLSNLGQSALYRSYLVRSQARAWDFFPFF